jgi:hypothetical protein
MTKYFVEGTFSSEAQASTGASTVSASGLTSSVLRSLRVPLSRFT